jgi:hypothetical protein
VQRNLPAEPLPPIANLNLHDAASFIEVKHDAVTDIFLFRAGTSAKRT